MEWLKFISGEKVQKIIKDLSDLSRSSDGKGRAAYAFSHVEDTMFHYVKTYAYHLNKQYTVLNRNLDFYEDAIGNLYLVLDSDKEFYVTCGSHLDSVVHGGDYDGVVGVAAGLEIFRVLFQNDLRAKYGFCLIVFRSEESAFTGVSCLGSQIATGQIDLEKLENIEYGFDDKVNLKNYLISRRKVDWEDLASLVEHRFTMLDRYKYFLELHIEQGKILDSLDQDVAVVGPGIGGAIRANIEADFVPMKKVITESEELMTLSVKGRADHSGGTPMNGVRGGNYRDDALVKSVLLLKQLLLNGVVIHDWYVSEGTYNTIPGMVVLQVVGQRQIVDQILTTTDLAVDFGSTDEQFMTGDEVEVWGNKQLDGVSNIIYSVENMAEELAMNEENEGIICAGVTGLELLGGKILMKFDLRMVESRVADLFLTKLKEIISELGFSYQELSAAQPTLFDQDLISQLHAIGNQICEDEVLTLPSMPGHDARNMNRAGIKTGMIFVKCRDGISHSPEEFVEVKSLEVGARFLAAALMKLAAG